MYKIIVAMAVFVVCLMPIAGAAADQPTEQPPLRVAVDAPYPPFAMIDQHGELTGFDVDIAKALCAHMGRECAFGVRIFSGIIASIEAGETDLAVAGFGKTEDRQRRVNFSEPYFHSPSVFVQWGGQFKDHTPETLRGRRIAAQAGTVQGEYLKKTYGQDIVLVSAPSYPEVLGLLKSGQADLAMLEGPPALFFLSSDEGKGFRLVGAPLAPDSDDGASYIIVSKDAPALLDEVNKALEEIQRSGEYDRISRQYFDYSVY